MHCHNTMKAIIKKEMTNKGLNIEIRLVPCNIPYGQNENKQTTTAEEILVNCASIHIVHELLIELFQTKPDILPTETYFVPLPAHGGMTHEVYYNHLQIHHQYTAQ